MSVASVLMSLSEDDVVVTASERLARDLRVQRDLLKSSVGPRVWRVTGVISSLRSWVVKSWESTWPAEQLLHPVQELALYKYVIDSGTGSEGEHHSLLSSMSVARQAQKAGALVNTHHIDMSYETFGASSESASFKLWQQNVEAILAKKSWVTHDMLLDRLVALIKAGEVKAPRRMYFFGFVDITPQQNAFIDAMRECGVDVVLSDDVAGSPCSVEYHRHKTAVDESRAVAEWARQALEPYIDDPQSAPRLAVIASDVKKVRGVLERAFKEILAPDALVANLDVEGTDMTPFRQPWSFSVGAALSEYELVNAAMGILQVRLYENDSSVITRLLLNKRVSGWTTQAATRAKYDVRLREYLSRRVSLSQAVSLVNDNEGTFETALTSLHGMLKSESGSGRQSVLPSEWVARFKARLDVMGFPGDAPLGSRDYQIMSALDDAFAVFQSMDSQLADIEEERAYVWLREILSTTLFQPKLQFIPPIQVLSFWDCIGMRFDKAYIMGLDSMCLPEQDRPNALIPVHIQRAVNAPYSSPERQLESARNIIPYLMSLADDVHCSCPVTADDGSLISPSPLFDGWRDEIEPACSTSIINDVMSEGVVTYLPAQDEFPEVLDDEKARLKGGVSLLSAYFTSPFYAALRGRLGIREFPMPVAGLQRNFQGNVVHGALEFIWSELKDSKGLASATDEVLEDLIERGIDVALAKERFAEFKYGQNLVALERFRIKALIREWLEYEKTRTEPFTVKAREVRLSADIDGFEFNVVIDRIDEVISEDGLKIIEIDYKTSASVNTGDWSKGSLLQPQLPIYATFVNVDSLGIEQVDGIAFGHVFSGSCLTHIRSNWSPRLHETKSSRQDNFKPSVELWDMQLADWKEELTHAIRDFMAGSAHYDFSMDDRSPLFTDVKHLARIGERVTTSKEPRT